MGYEITPGSTGNLSSGGGFSNLETVDSVNYQNLSAESAAAAAASAASAATSATTATTQAATATTQATNASTSATNAATSATTATTQATNANTSATSAASSAASAAAIYDNFDDRYLGAKAVEPTLDNDGNALIIGALYFNSVTSVMRVYNGSAWSNFSGGGVAVSSVSGTAPVVSSGGVTPVISMAAANTTTNGYLTSTDWNIFNNKGSGAVTSVSGTTGRVTSTGGATPVIDLTSGIATAGTTGSSSLVPVVTIDTYGRVTSITTAANPQGTVTLVTGTAPVVSSGGTAPAISMAIATTSVDGYLTATDWTTFNSKQSAITLTTTGTSGASTFVGNTLNIPQYSGAGTVTSVAATVPSFLSVIGSPITTSGTLAINYSGTALPVANGGTGATTAGGALTSLGAIGSVASADSSVTVAQTGTAVDLSVATAASTTNVLCQVRNATGATLTKGTAVYISGTVGQIPTVSKALATSDATSAQTLGLMTADLANNSNGFVTVIGLITNINTSAYADGAQLYLSGTTAGTLTATKPYAPIHLVYMAVVEHSHATQGKLFVKVQNGYELDEIHNVSAQTPSNGQTIIWNATTSLWEAANITAGTGISVTNGAGSITVANTGVTSVTGTSPIASSGGATPVISLTTNYGDTQNPYASKTANYVLAAPNGTAGVPTFRAIAAADIPTLNQNTTGTASNVTGTVAIANGGSGTTTAQLAMNAFASAVTSGYYLRGNGTNVVMNTIQVADVPTLNQNTTGSAGSVVNSLTSGTGILFSSGTTYNGSAAITVTNSLPMVYPSSGISNSTGTGWSTSYSTTGTGTVVALATSPSFVTPVLGTVTSGNFSTGTFTWPTFNQNTTGTSTNVTGTVAIINGGTGQTTAGTAFNALSPITTTGDLILGNGVNSATRLGIGANSYVLTSNGTTASWAAATGGVTQIIAGTNVTISPTGGTGAVTINASGGGGASAYTRTSFTATAGQTAFTVTYSVGYLQVYVNGVLLATSDYTATSGTGFTLGVACVAGDIVEALVITTSVIANGVSTGKSIAMAMIFGF